MRRDFARLGNGNRFRQEETAAIACIADPLANACAPGEPRSIESILQQKRHVEFLSAQFRGQPFAAEDSRVFRPRIIRDELIADFLLAINISDVRPRKNRNFRLREMAAHGSQRRQRHNCIAHPVRRANQDFHAATPRRSLRARSRAA
jgi:hypothetical protein